MELRVLRLESSIIYVPTYLASAFLGGSYQCGGIVNDFDANDPSLTYVARIYLEPRPPALTVDYITRIDILLFHFLQFLKRDVYVWVMK